MHLADGRFVHLERHLRKNVKGKNQVEGIGTEWDLGNRGLRDFQKSTLAYPLERVHGHVETINIATGGGTIVSKVETRTAARIEHTQIRDLKFGGSYRIGNLTHRDKPPVVFFELI